MKKILLLLLIVLFVTANAYSELNVKAGVDTFGALSFLNKGNGGGRNTDIGYSAAAEYLYPVSGIIKIGLGAEYLFSRETKEELLDDDDTMGQLWSSYEFNYMPVYLTAKISLEETLEGLYLKGNIGYNVLHDLQLKSTLNGHSLTSDFGSDHSGGIYFALGAGYEFPFGLLFDVMYSYYSDSFKFDVYSDIINGRSVYTKLGFNIGYKLDI
jgi:hypothetical protein